MIGSMLRKAQLLGGCAATAAPDAPYDLTSSGVTSSSITLNWEDATSTPNEASSYEVGISSNGGTTWTTVTVSAPASLYTFTSLSAGTTYDFRIRGVNCFGTGSYDGEAFTQATSVGTLSPSWSIDFSSGTPSGYVLTRASSGTYVDSSGYIASQASGASGNSAARLTHNSSGTRLGLLVEESRTNILPNSEDFGTSWAGGNCNVSTNAVNAPTNTLVADKVAANTTNTSHWLRRATSSPVVGTTYVFSVFFKAGGGAVTHVYLTLNGQVTAGDVNYSAKYNVTTGARTDTDSDNAPANTDSPTQAEDYGNGWWRAWIRMENPTGSAGLRAMVGLSNVATGAILPTFAGAAGDADFAYFWGAQVEASTTTPTAFIPTTTATVTRSADLAHVLDSAITDWGWGALVIHFYPPGQAGTLISTDDASASQYGIQANTATSAQGFWQTGQTTSATLGTGLQKAAHFINGSTSKFVLNGGTVYSGTNDVTHSNIDFVTLGAEATDSSGVPGTFSQWANCVIRKIEWYGDGNLTNAQLQAITT